MTPGWWLFVGWCVVFLIVVFEPEWSQALFDITNRKQKRKESNHGRPRKTREDHPNTKASFSARYHSYRVAGTNTVSAFWRAIKDSRGGASMTMSSANHQELKRLWDAVNNGMAAMHRDWTSDTWVFTELDGTIWSFSDSVYRAASASGVLQDNAPLIRNHYRNDPWAPYIRAIKTPAPSPSFQWPSYLTGDEDDATPPDNTHSTPKASIGSLKVEDQPDTIVGYKWGSFKIKDKTLLIAGAHDDRGYGVEAEAKCQKGMFSYSRGDGCTELPGEACACGFYAYDKDNYMREHTYGKELLLEVELYGRVVVHERGMRASHQRVLKITVPSCSASLCSSASSNWCVANGINGYQRRCTHHSTGFNETYAPNELAGMIGTEVVSAPYVREADAA